ncbi:hypothetical protein OPV22_021432 [Ensete ventricosum]|uniref:snRNA-activating protein complex subunit 3 n=1 Tax=Ensete ventricosum TaxID=4639 RepID=A0AAV8QIU1_ENSVE|nr:hypothetical protein OPV22_021432 [Ensete ventricosum]
METDASALVCHILMTESLSQVERVKQAMEETREAAAELRFQDHGSRLPFARGGPIFSPGLVGPITSVPDFKSSILEELQSLQAELASTEDFEQELSVDELKVLTEEELVEIALKEEDSSRLLECSGNGIVGDASIGKETICSTSSTMERSNLESSANLKVSHALTCETDVSKKKVKKKGGKRGRRFDRDCRAAELEGDYFAKVEELAKIKKRQDEDKLAARLHSFSGNSKLVEGATSTSQKIERMKSLRFITSPVKVTSLSQEHVPIYFPELILCVEIYAKKSTLKKTQEFLVLGSQVLTELKDRIYCLTDKLMEMAGEHDPSGYFLIEDTFCNDLRNPFSIDYSKTVFDWLKDNSDEAVEKWEYIMSGELKKKQKELLGDANVSSLPKFKALDMHKTRFSDLRFRLGSGYLYCHQGNCKHIIVIRDMRLIHPEDVQNRADYPLLTYQLRRHYRKCSVCDIYIATKMTVDDKWAPVNPCYFCIKCYFLLHYKEDNSLLYPHTVFDYVHE